MLPPSLFVTGVQLKGTNPFRGGFADVYQGIYKDQLVALKVLRIHTTDPDQKVQMLAKVSSWIYSRNISRNQGAGILSGGPHLAAAVSPQYPSFLRCFRESVQP